MSLILEALRKSEAERQRGRAPGLFVEQQALQRRERRGPPGWAIAGPVLLVVLLLGWGWREWSRDAEVATPSPADAGADATADAASSAIGAPPAPAADPVAAVVAVDVDPAAPAPRSDAPQVAAPRPGPPQPPPPANPTAGPLPPPALDPATLPVLPMPAADPVAEVAAGARAGTPAVASTPPAATTDDGLRTPNELLPRLADLSAGERAALPPLQLSMHVYSDDPARRFVILDDRRLTEGATPAPGLVVEQIRRDGAVLSLNGRRVLLPRP